ncbi:MAG: HAMP domain-containing histidine kinase, partial [Halobacteriovoraceae bacterium]|nr:HAMP domain-containing histidine kinase [Halobacteriovoraceae bacterium]
RFQVVFTDSGNGIPKEIRQNIFESFYTTKEKGKGTGLGLSLCKKIVEAHGGTLEIDPNAENTKFIIEMPLVCKEPVESLA